MTTPLLFSAFVMNTTSHILHGVWRQPNARQIEFNSLDKELDLNLLVTYRINAGTVFFVGYDDHYQQADLIEGDRDGDGFNEQLFFTQRLRRTNRAIFVKLQYLLRY